MALLDSPRKSHPIAQAPKSGPAPSSQNSLSLSGVRRQGCITRTVPTSTWIGWAAKSAAASAAAPVSWYIFSAPVTGGNEIGDR